MGYDWSSKQTTLPSREKGQIPWTGSSGNTRRQDGVRNKKVILPVALGWWRTWFSPNCIIQSQRAARSVRQKPLNCQFQCLKRTNYAQMRNAQIPFSLQSPAKFPSLKLQNSARVSAWLSLSNLALLTRGVASCDPNFIYMVNFQREFANARLASHNSLTESLKSNKQTKKRRKVF